jgi:Ca-activated chloride channel family protein
MKPLALFLVLAAVASSSSAGAAPSALELDVGLARPVLLAGRKNLAHLRVSLIGQSAPPSARRPVVNVCLAIDRSGSMQGEKIASARQGAIAALRRLGPADIVSVVAYDDVVQVLVPATRASERGFIEHGIRELQPGGSTALFAGVVKCAGELRKFADRNRVNRIVLLSDGVANVGPSSAAELGALGAQLMEEGISVATVGLGTGYNADLMNELAMRSDGGHVFVENARDLGRFLDEELQAATAVVARDVDVRIRCGQGVRPLRVLGRPADIVGGTVTAPFAKVYARRQHYFVLELEVDPSPGQERRLADVQVKFHDLLRNQDDQRSQPVVARFSPRPSAVDAAANPAIVAELGMIDDNAASESAMQMLKRGDTGAARRILEDNAARLEETMRVTKDHRLAARARRARTKAREVESRPVVRSILDLHQVIDDDPLGGLKLDDDSLGGLKL